MTRIELEAIEAFLEAPRGSTQEIWAIDRLIEIANDRRGTIEKAKAWNRGANPS